MQDLNDKITGGSLTAIEWNEVPSELQNVIEDLGLVLSSGDLNQLGKAIVDYSSAGTFYSETGVADAYVATIIGAKQGLHALSAVMNGAIVRFRPGNVNTGASTLNVNSLGVKDVVREDGGVLNAADLDTTRDALVRWDQTADDWRVLNSSLVTPGVLGADSATGLFNARFASTTTGTAKLEPGITGTLDIDIDGTVLSQNGNLVFTLDGDLDLDTGVEQNSKAYFCYVEDVAGTMTPHISLGNPVDYGDATNKVGYHPTNTTWRCVGSFWNDENGDIVPFYMSGNIHQFQKHVADHEVNLPSTESTSWQPQLLNLPKTVTRMHGTIMIDLTASFTTCYGISTAFGTLPTGDGTVWDEWFSSAALEWAKYVVKKRAGPEMLSVEIPIALRSAPAIAVGVLDGSPTLHRLIVTGYVDPWAPKS